MSFISLIKAVKYKAVVSFVILVFIASIFVLGYCFIEQKLPIKTIAIILFVIVVLQVLVLQYLYKNELKNKIKQVNTEARIDALKDKLELANKQADFSSECLVNINYELRSPLSTIIGMLEMLKTTNIDAKQHTQIDIAEISSKYMHQLVNMFVNNTEVDRGDITINNAAFDLNSDLINLFKVFEYQAWEKGLAFEYEFLKNEKSKFSLIGDTLRIQQVVINLVNNAIKFTSKGEISVIVDQTISIGEDQIITFYIKDTGIGMPPEAVKQIFDTSKKEATLLTDDYRGGGLGLSTSHKLVKLMGSELKLETQKNEGTTFYFSLQLKRTLSVHVETKEFKPVLTKKRNVLVADDSRMSRRVIKFLLEQQGVDCTFAKNGVEAVELYRILDFDLVFMDLYMPDLNGFEAIKAIKETTKYNTNKTPIIAVSASAFKEDKVKVEQFGINEFLDKPIDISMLKDILIKYLLTKQEVI